MLTRIQGEEVAWTEGMPDPKRVQAFKCQSAQAGPLLIINLYMPAGQSPAQAEHRRALTQQTIEWGVKTGLDFIAIGDWNAEQTEEAPRWLTLRGGLQRADELWDQDVRTTTSNAGDRFVDYALIKGSVKIMGGAQGRAHSPTRDFVCYQVGIGGKLRGKRWARAQRLGDHGA